MNSNGMIGEQFEHISAKLDIALTETRYEQGQVRWLHHVKRRQLTNRLVIDQADGKGNVKKKYPKTITKKVLIKTDNL